MRTALVSPQWSAHTSYCFTFWFDLTVGINFQLIQRMIHINFQNSDGIKELQVILSQVETHTETAIWKYLSLLETWSQARVRIPPMSDFKAINDIDIFVSLNLIHFRCC